MRVYTFVYAKRLIVHGISRIVHGFHTIVYDVQRHERAAEYRAIQRINAARRMRYGPHPHPHPMCRCTVDIDFKQFTVSIEDATRALESFRRIGDIARGNAEDFVRTWRRVMPPTVMD